MGLIEVIKKIPIIIDIILGIIIIEKFDFPETFIAIISSVFFILKKNQIPDNKMTNGNILKSKLGTNRSDNVIGIFNPTSKSLNKFISSNKLIIKPKQKKKKLMLITTLKNSEAKYLFDSEYFIKNSLPRHPRTASFVFVFKY